MRNHMPVLTIFIDYGHRMVVIGQVIGLGGGRGDLERGKGELVDLLALHGDHVGRGEGEDARRVLRRRRQNRLLRAARR